MSEFSGPEFSRNPTSRDSNADFSSASSGQFTLSTLLKNKILRFTPPAMQYHKTKLNYVTAIFIHFVSQNTVQMYNKCSFFTKKLFNLQK